MATLGDMRTRIADELQIDKDEYAVEIDRAIFTSIQSYSDEDLWFLEAVPLKVIFTATSAYALTTLLPGRSAIRNLSLSYDPNVDPLEYRTPAEFSWLQSSNVGDPVYWTIYADQLMLQNIPGRTFTAVVWYTGQNSMTASASAESVWTNQGEELIRQCAKVDLLMNRIRDFEAANVIQAQLLNYILPNLHSKTVVRRGSRRIQPHW